MHAIRGIDLEMNPGFVSRHFVNGSGTIILARVAVLANAAIRADIPIADVQMARLIFFVTRAGIIDVGQAIKGEQAIAP